ncbi:hypothetical protein [Nonomuraea aurantiaca]|jgi:hypothetical protein|uniref:hypothetical protein n=1 Tax=Nonomuraea aurantiaca TaxID=2878562 RepID=UPI001CD9AA63|nr:hypothetical protein [Nonomuraea aurantiaca]MCA2229856.1 hypothetical protein [Nonomuraea aurantiaca]
MSRHTDIAAPGRLRRLALTAVPPLLVLLVPMTLVGLYGERLPARAYIESWAVHTGYAPTWKGWLSGRCFTLVWFEVTLLLPFLRYWRLPQPQRGMVILSFVIAASLSASTVLAMTALLDSPGPVTRPAWHLGAEIAVTVVAAALGYRAAGPIPSPPAVMSAPPSHAPTMALGRHQRILFVTSTWSLRRLLLAAILGALAVLSVGNGSDAWQGTALLALWALFEAAQARTSLQIDGSGITVRASGLPVLRRRVPYSLIRFAEARSRAPEGRYKLDDSSSGWGVVNGRAPVLVLSLSDDRSFVYSTREAQTAAALVNGWLSRQRLEETA